MAPSNADWPIGEKPWHSEPDLDAAAAHRDPLYWMNETSGQLHAAVRAYLHGDQLTDDQVNLMRAYVRQWIEAPVWKGPKIPWLRQAVNRITSHRELQTWLRVAELDGIDPL
jgi:hypothetical protein